MQPPSTVCETLFRKHNQLRIGWAGEPGPGLNKGTFALIQLYHINNYGNVDDPNSILEYWQGTSRLGESGVMERVKIDRGPIFSKHGTERCDYDPLTRVPIYVMSLNEAYKFPWGEPIKNVVDTLNGKFLGALDYWFSPMKPRIVKNRRDLVAKLRSDSEDIGDAVTDELWFNANKPSETGNNTIAYKHCKKDLVRIDHDIQDDRLDSLYGI